MWHDLILPLVVFMCPPLDWGSLGFEWHLQGEKQGLAVFAQRRPHGHVVKNERVLTAGCGPSSANPQDRYQAFHRARGRRDVCKGHKSPRPEGSRHRLLFLRGLPCKRRPGEDGRVAPVSLSLPLARRCPLRHTCRSLLCAGLPCPLLLVAVVSHWRRQAPCHRRRKAGSGTSQTPPRAQRE